MTPFLFGTDIRARLVELIDSSSEINCAVAFWGNGAEELFATSPKKSIRIICDLMSGACNPAVIRKLMSVGAAVKMVNGMHAKVYWTPVGAIIGSANASANGLGEEGAETAEQAEAAIYTHEPETLRDVSMWFENQWNDGESVDRQLLRRAEELWKRRRIHRPVRSQNSLLDLLQKNPDWFRERGMRLLVYEGEDISKAGRVAWERSKRDLYYSTLLREYEERGELPVYEDATGWDLPPGEFMIDYSGPVGKPSFNGIWRVREHNPFIPIGTSKKHRLILLDRIDVPPFDLQFPRKEQNALCKQIIEVWAQKGWKQDKNLNYLDVALDKAGRLLWP